MESEPKTIFWNVDATGFIPSGLPIFVLKSQAPPKSKKKHYHKPKQGHKEEKKFNPRYKPLSPRFSGEWRILTG